MYSTARTIELTRQRNEADFDQGIYSIHFVNQSNFSVEVSSSLFGFLRVNSMEEVQYRAHFQCFFPPFSLKIEFGGEGLGDVEDHTECLKINYVRCQT